MAGGQEEVKLLGSWVSPFVYRVKWALNLKNIQYEYLEQDLVNKSNLLLTCNPVFKRVPVLIHNDKIICESIVIMEYLDEVWKNNPILPEDPYEIAMVRFWTKFIEEKFTEVARKVLFLDGEQQENEVKNAKEALESIEGELKGKKFFGGETIGYLDLVMGFIAIGLDIIEEVSCVKMFDSLKYPSFIKWMEDFLELPLIKECSPNRDELVLYFRKIRQIKLALAAKK
ncbi:putative glutathione S-transferase [Camellia lanceoleosa]|uniref:Glutathione S-transferase n=1 Tax=Camellia lanceoleosa TaxID=1840588 RepID=A0ACC0I673_9ERIC|nr:putative glutathione S-transferase [Camellia lanceoleosa]